MKTQIISIQSHDNLVSIRDRMSWAKSPRILLLWPPIGRVQLRALDLRVLQQHARELGSLLGIVTRSSSVRRDAARFGIPIFGSAAEAQRTPWIARPRLVSKARPRRAPASLRRTLTDQRQRSKSAALGPAVRIGLFALAVVATLMLVATLLPAATITVTPKRLIQEQTISAVTGTNVPFAPASGELPSHLLKISVSGSRSTPILSTALVAQASCTGVARFRNLTQSLVILPPGTVVFSTSPARERFATTTEGRLDAAPSGSAELPIQCLEPGESGNVPANSIQAVEGPLGASVAVTNPEATSGGSSRLAAVASDQDREQARTQLLDDLRANAEDQLRQLAGPSNTLLAATIKPSKIVLEKITPAVGQLGTVLSVDMEVEFSAEYVESGDLDQVANVRLSAEAPRGYEPVPGSLVVRVLQQSLTPPSGPSTVQLTATRTLMHVVDPFQTILLVRGRTPIQAVESLQSALPLSAPPEIRLSPPWWPWLPQIPIRISIDVA